jgi:NACalpha-BTF3-like transcription factor
MMFQATQDPVWLDDVDYDAVTAYDAKISDVPSEIFRTADEILKIREARAAQQAMQMQQEMLQQQQMQQQMQQAAQQQQQQTTGGSPELGGEEVMLG